MIFRIRFFSALFLITSILTVIGCSAYGMPQEPSGFSFDMRYDDQHASVLDYKLYGENSTIYGAQAALIERGHVFNGDGIGYHGRPHSLYVKWKDEISGNIYEVTAEFDRELPQDLSGTDLYFLIHGSQLYVYLALKDNLVSGAPVIGGTIYRNKKNIQLYPTTNK